LRIAKRSVWPRSELSMSLVGFDHVFSRCVGVELSPGILCNVAPLPVIAFLKITAYLEDRHRRAKDLDDLKLLLGRYASGTERIFSDDVFSAHLEDIDLASAFLLGLDIKAFAEPEELCRGVHRPIPSRGRVGPVGRPARSSLS
jgi:predicted nucleotidyltransferase